MKKVFKIKANEKCCLCKSTISFEFSTSEYTTKNEFLSECLGVPYHECPACSGDCGIYEVVEFEEIKEKIKTTHEFIERGYLYYPNDI